MAKGGIARWQNKSSKGMSRKVREAIYLSRLNACDNVRAYRANVISAKEKSAITAAVKAITKGRVRQTRKRPTRRPHGVRLMKAARPQWAEWSMHGVSPQKKNTSLDDINEILNWSMFASPTQAAAARKSNSFIIGSPVRPSRSPVRPSARDIINIMGYDDNLGDLIGSPIVPFRSFDVRNNGTKNDDGFLYKKRY